MFYLFIINCLGCCNRIYFILGDAKQLPLQTTPYRDITDVLASPVSPSTTADTVLPRVIQVLPRPDEIQTKLSAVIESRPVQPPLQAGSQLECFSTDSVPIRARHLHLCDYQFGSEGPPQMRASSSFSRNFFHRARNFVGDPISATFAHIWRSQPPSIASVGGGKPRKLCVHAR